MSMTSTELPPLAFYHFLMGVNRVCRHIYSGCVKRLPSGIRRNGTLPLGFRGLRAGNPPVPGTGASPSGTPLGFRGFSPVDSPVPGTGALNPTGDFTRRLRGSPALECCYRGYRLRKNVYRGLYATALRLTKRQRSPLGTKRAAQPFDDIRNQLINTYKVDSYPFLIYCAICH